MCYNYLNGLNDTEFLCKHTWCVSILSLFSIVSFMFIEQPFVEADKTSVSHLGLK